MSIFALRSNGLASSAYKNLSSTQSSLNANIGRLSSGLRINSTADDSAGSNVSVRMSNQVRGMSQANRNAQDANNLLATAESGLSDISDILSKMRELSVQAATDTLNNTDRASLDLEYQSLMDEISRIATSTNYNDLNVLDAESVKYDNFFTVISSEAEKAAIDSFFARSMSSVRESFCWSTLRLLRALSRSAHPVSTTLMMKAPSTTNADTFFIWFLLKRKNINFLLVLY